MRVQIVSGIVVLLSLCTAAAVGHAEPAQTLPVRVALLREVATVPLQAAALRCGIPPLPAAATDDPTLVSQATISATPAGIMVNAQFFQSDQLLCDAVRGALFINHTPVHGTLHLYRSGTGTAAPRLTAVEELPLEEYLQGVVSGEMQSTWPAETLKAQAVVARSYVMTKLQTTNAHAVYDVDATIEDQVYQPNFHPAATIVDAVSATRGEVVLQQGKILKTYFHSCCGGNTLPAEAVWGAQAAQGLRAVRDPYCARSPYRQWTYQLTRADLEHDLAAAGFITPRVKDIRVPAGSDRPTDITLTTDGDPLHLSADNFRRTIGYKALKSTWFTAHAHKGGWIFQGRGYGHGVGLCQWGAKTMGERKKTYRDMLQFYYPGTMISNIYTTPLAQSSHTK